MVTTTIVIGATCVYLLWMISLIMYGIFCLAEDYTIRVDACGKDSAAWRYGLLSTGFTIGEIITYLGWPGGGEGTRARALLCLIVHLGFTVWVALMHSNMSAACAEVFFGKFLCTYIFTVCCGAHHSILAVLYALHEVWLGSYVGFDLTIIAEVSVGTHTPEVGTRSLVQDAKFTQQVLAQQQSDQFYTKQSDQIPQRRGYSQIPTTPPQSPSSAVPPLPIGSVPKATTRGEDAHEDELKEGVRVL